MMRWCRRKIRPSGQEQHWTVGASPITSGAYSYGLNRIKVREWGEGAALTIGKFCSIAEGVEVVLGGNHRTDWMTTYPFGHIFKDIFGPAPHPGHPATRGDVNIGNDVWIGEGALILSGVTIGDGAVIAARAVVTRDVEPYAIAVGNPARTVKTRFSPEVTALLRELAWWDLAPEDIRLIVPRLSAKPEAEELRQLLLRYRGQRTPGV